MTSNPDRANQDRANQDRANQDRANQDRARRTPRAAGAVLLAAGLLAALTITAPPASAATTTRTFETDAVGAVPAGCAAPSGATAAVVSDVRGHDSARSLRFDDTSASTFAGLDCQDATRHGADLRFAVYPAALANGFSFTLLGHVEGFSDVRPVFHFNVDATNALRWYDGLGWTRVAGPGTVPNGAWTDVRVQVPSGQEHAYLYAGGRYVGDAGPWGVRRVTDVTGFRFGSAGTATTGDDVFVDDVAIGDPDDTPPATGEPFTVGPDVTIATSTGTPVQMPNTAAVVTVDGQQQTLVSYPEHGDATQDGGNRLVVSTDRGTSWQDANARNPMPDVHSYMLSTLRNGDVLAVAYHTYMTPGSGNVKAEVPTAISHDGGRTWTQRAGTMTAPQGMRPISDVTDRPGSPLGGFVLVHNVVEDPDGTLYQSGYGYYRDDTKYRQIVLKSTDAGANWTLAATIAYDPGLSSDSRYEGFDEAALARLADGSLYAVMRTGSFQPMYASRSTDHGATWSAPRPLAAGADGAPVVGVYPTLLSMPDGSLLLWIGRPGQAMLRSADGTGDDWTRPQFVDFRNSGNGAMVALDAGHVLTVGDRGPDWAAPPPSTYRVWSRLVTVR